MKAQITKINALLTEQVEKIGEGAYSKVYRSLINPSKVYIVAPNGDNAKEALVNCGNNAHLPKLTRVGIIVIKEIEQVIYSTEYSTEPTGNAKEIATQLNTLWCNFKRANLSIITVDTSNRAALVETFINSLASHNIAESVIDALTILVTELKAFGNHLWLDFPMRNFAMNCDGTLILRDIASYIDFNAKW